MGLLLGSLSHVRHQYYREKGYAYDQRNSISTLTYVTYSRTDINLVNCGLSLLHALADMLCGLGTHLSDTG